MDIEKLYYSIQEVKEMTNLPTSTLRYWEAQFKQLSPRKDKHGNRYYNQQDIELIKQMERQGKSREEINAVLKEKFADKKPNPSA